LLMARAAAPMLSGLRGATSTTRKLFRSAGKSHYFTPRWIKLALEQLSFLCSLSTANGVILSGVRSFAGERSASRRISRGHGPPRDVAGSFSVGFLVRTPSRIHSCAHWLAILRLRFWRASRRRSFAQEDTAGVVWVRQKPKALQPQGKRNLRV